MQYLYLIKCQQFVKIGVANDVQNRIAQLSTGNPFKLELLAVFAFESANTVEAALHQRFLDKRKRGEWFVLSLQELRTLRNVCLLLGGDELDVLPTVQEKEIEEEELLAEAPANGAKYDYAAMFADGWRMEPTSSKGKNGVYWCWRKGSETTGREYIYGGLISELPYQSLEKMRQIYGK